MTYEIFNPSTIVKNFVIICCVLIFIFIDTNPTQHTFYFSSLFFSSFTRFFPFPSTIFSFLHPPTSLFFSLQLLFFTQKTNIFPSPTNVCILQLFFSTQKTRRSQRKKKLVAVWSQDGIFLVKIILFLLEHLQWSM